MNSVLLHLRFHQPHRLAPFKFFDIGTGASYFAPALDRRHLDRVGETTYEPLLALLARLGAASSGRFVACFSVSASLLEQLRAWHPALLEQMAALVRTGICHPVSEVGARAISSLFPPAELATLIEGQAEALARQLGGARPAAVFVAEPLPCDALYAHLQRCGPAQVLGELVGVPPRRDLASRAWIPAGRAPLRLLGRSVQLDELRQEDGIERLLERNVEGAVHYVSLSCEELGGPPWTGGFEELETVLTRLSRDPRATLIEPRGLDTVSAVEVDLPAPQRSLDDRAPLLVGNPLQLAAYRRLQELGIRLRSTSADSTGQPVVDWVRLACLDNLHALAQGRAADLAAPTKSSYYASPANAFVNFMNVLADLETRIEEHPSSSLHRAVSG